MAKTHIYALDYCNGIIVHYYMDYDEFEATVRTDNLEYMSVDKELEIQEAEDL